MRRPIVERALPSDAETAARAKNVSWTRIGELLGTSAQAAQQRYGNVIATG